MRQPHCFSNLTLFCGFCTDIAAKEIKEKCCNRISVVLESISRCLRPDDQSHKIDFLKISWSRIALRVLYNVSGGW